MVNEGRPFLNVLDTLLRGRGKDTLYQIGRAHV